MLKIVVQNDRDFMEVIIIHTLVTLAHTVYDIYCAYCRDHKGN
jgi:hypothetical protein